MHHPMCLLLQRRGSNQSSCTSLSFHSLIKWSWVTSWFRSPVALRLFPRWGPLRPPQWQSGTLAAACHGQPLTGNWVFIRLPVREKCSVFIWHNYQEKWSLPPLWDTATAQVGMVKASGSSTSIYCGVCQNLVDTTEHKRGNCFNKHAIPARCDLREMTIIFSSNGLLLGRFSKLL